MEIQSFLKSKYSKFIIGIIAVIGIIYLAKSGYLFGQWLYKAFN